MTQDPKEIARDICERPHLTKDEIKNVLCVQCHEIAQALTSYGLEKRREALEEAAEIAKEFTWKSCNSEEICECHDGICTAIRAKAEGK